MLNEPGKDVEVRMYTNMPFDFEYTVVATYTQEDLKELLIEEGEVPEDWHVTKISGIKATSHLSYADMSGTITTTTEYVVYFGLIGPSGVAGKNSKIEDLPSKMRDIKLKRLI